MESILLNIHNMSRYPVIQTNLHPYHIRARSNNRDWFDVPMNYCFGVFTNTFKESIKRYGISLHGFVLMNNHFHLMVSTPNENISAFLKYFMTQTSKGIAKKSSRINHIYGGRNQKTLIKSSVYYAHCLKYIYRNPVKAGISDTVENYPWSTASKIPNKLQKLISPITLGHDEHLPEKNIDQIIWFNEAPPSEINHVIKCSLRRSVFIPKASSKTRKRLNFEKWLAGRSNTSS